MEEALYPDFSLVKVMMMMMYMYLFLSRRIRLTL